MTDHTLRPFASMDDYRACVELQEETWGDGFSERVSPAILKVSQILGGVAAGAFDADDRLDGFVFGMTGPRNGVVVHWSDMLAVRRHLRDSGLGRRLKAYQRQVLLARGVEVMHWTFDPLQSRNAHLNFRKLGIVVREYVRDMYGASDSPLHQGIGTDRFVAHWAMASERVERRLAGDGGPAEVPTAAASALDDPADGAALDLDADTVTVAVPADVTALMARDMAAAVAWREATRAALVHYLDRGWEVRDFVRGDPVSRYVLVRSSP